MMVQTVMIPLLPARIYCPPSLARGALILLLGTSAAPAEPLCPVTTPMFTDQIGDPQRVELTAETVEADAETIELQGGVELQSQAQMIGAERITWQRQQEQLQLEGRVFYRSPHFTLESERGELNRIQQSGHFSHSRFWLTGYHAHGGAETLTLIQDRELELTGVTYTTCPDPASGWQLQAETIRLAPADNLGEAWHTRLQLAGLPLLYIPYLNFPLSGRKTGLLAPVLGRSTLHGSSLTQPFYWNIAPNYDATLALHWLESRGSVVESEWRYLTPTQQGEIHYHLPLEDRTFGERRSFGRWRHRAEWPQWGATIDWSQSSDPDYLRDIGVSSLSDDSVTLTQQGELGYYPPNGSATLRYEAYPSLIGVDHRRRQPQLELQWQSPLFHQAQLALTSRLTRFTHSSSGTIDRTHLTADLHWLRQQPAYLLQPRLRLLQRAYSSATEPTPEGVQTTAQVSLLGRLFLETPQKALGGRQSLEPTLFYLYSTADAAEAANPNLDSSELDFGWPQLFAVSHFAGDDYSGAAHQLTFALNQSFYRAEGGERWLQLQIGKIHHFNPYPNLSSTEWQNHPYRDYLVAGHWSPTAALSLNLQQQWDVQGTLSTSLVQLRWSEPDRNLRLGYRHQPERLIQQGYLAAAYNLNQHWQLATAWQQNLELNRLEKGLAAAEYQHCCWKVRLIAERQWLDGSQLYDQSWQMQFELTGLSSTTDSLHTELDRGTLMPQF